MKIFICKSTSKAQFDAMPRHVKEQYLKEHPSSKFKLLPLAHSPKGLFKYSVSFEFGRDSSSTKSYTYKIEAGNKEQARYVAIRKFLKEQGMKQVSDKEVQNIKPYLSNMKIDEL